jgi:dTDP-4-dehydrorhamnose 3,5-epimerase
MQFVETLLKGAYIVEIDAFHDERGFFARSWCREEFTRHGLNPNLVQCSVSFNTKRGTLRGMHYQIAPHEEAKVVRCTRGAIYDVIIDLRPNSGTFKQWVALELTADNHRMVYVPEGFAHGFQTLTDNSEVFYQMSTFYQPQFARGVRWDDPAFALLWPESELRIISEKDQQYPDFVL